MYLRVDKPLALWIRPRDDLNILFRHLNELLSGGVVVWGHIVQANGMLFENGDDDNYPGELVYSLADRNKVGPQYLAHVAERLFSLKGTRPHDPQLAPIARYLTDEMIRVFGLAVPASISPDARCQISTTMFIRKHLPQRRLCCSVLPILVNPRKPFVALPLPARYWPPEFVNWWSS